jgi:hypothetical protein
MKLSALLRNLRTQRLYSAFATEDIEPMSEVFVSWPKLIEFGWKVGVSLVIVSQGFTALQLQILKMEMDTNMKAMADEMTNMKTMLKAMDDKLTQALQKKPKVNGPD